MNRRNKKIAKKMAIASGFKVVRATKEDVLIVRKRNEVPDTFKIDKSGISIVRSPENEVPKNLKFGGYSFMAQDFYDQVYPQPQVAFTADDLVKAKQQKEQDYQAWSKQQLEKKIVKQRSKRGGE